MPGEPGLAIPQRLTAGQHELQLRITSRPGTALRIVVEAPGPVVDGFEPAAGPVGTALTLQGEGFFAPARVLSDSVELDTPSVLSERVLATVTVPGMPVGPLTVVTPFGETTSTQTFVPDLDVPIPPADPNDNLLTRSVAQRPMDPRIVMVPRDAFEAALQRLPADQRTTSSVEAISIATDADSLANDPWTGGVLAVQGVQTATALQRTAALPLGRSVTADVFLVVDDPQVTAEGVIVATRYSFAALPMTVNTQWFATGAAFGVIPNLQFGTGRCCGPERICETETGEPPEGDGCVPTPNTMCGGTMFVERDPNRGAAAAAEQAGRVPVQALFFKSGVPMPSTCFPKVVPGCLNASGMCDDSLDFDVSQTWDVSIPSQDCTGQTADRNYSGRVVPEICTYAQGVSVFAGAGGALSKGPGHSAAECDGRCFECEQGLGPVDREGRPRQCNLTKTSPGGICDSSAATREAAQAALRLQFGFGTPWAEGTKCLAPNELGVMWCATCDADGCHRTARAAWGPEGGVSYFRTVAAGDNAQVSFAPLKRVGSGNPAPPPSAGPGALASAQTTDTDLPAEGATSPPAAEGDDGKKPNPPAPTPKPKPEHPSVQQVAMKDEKKDADPVSVVDGSFTLTHVDLSFDGPARPLQFVRSYSSRSRLRSELGSNWTHNFDVRIVPLREQNLPDYVDPYCAGTPDEVTCVMLYVGDSARIFTRDAETHLYMPQAGVMATIARGDTGWAMRDANGHKLLFDEQGHLVRDTDRFGNALTIEWEDNAWGALYDAVCPQKLMTLSGTLGTWSDPAGPFLKDGTRYLASTMQCALLAGLTGRGKQLIYEPVNGTQLTAAQLKLPAAASSALEAAKALLVQSQSGEGRGIGSGSIFGVRMKRVKSVKDDAGRQLLFEYWPDSDTTTMVAGSGQLRRSGLLRAVHGPEGATVKYEYATPNGHPAHLNEAFLVSVERADSAPANPQLDETPVRTQRFEYAWQRNAIDSAQVEAARARYAAYLLAAYNCTYHSVDACGQHVMAAGTRVNTFPDIEAFRAGFISDVADNIIEVRTEQTGITAVVEAETRYDVDVFSRSFDQATRQRWGSSIAPQAAAGGDWTTTLPEASFQYAEAGPTGNGADSTDAFLEAAGEGSGIAARYPLEVAPAGTAEYAASKGMLLPPDAPVGTEIPNRLVPIAEGEVLAGSGLPACKLGNLPYLRAALPGYRPAYDYFDAANVPAVGDPMVPSPGVDLDMPLQRSRLSCSQLATAQTWDARHNDLEWRWSKGTDGKYFATRILGRRKHTAANANRICAWTRVTDRDGDVHVYGLNYHGRPLVDAVRVDGVWRFAETLYNADGNVLSQRRTMREGQPWNSNSGDTRYAYMDAEKVGNELVAPLPWYWARRGNVTAIIERPRGGLIDEAVETNPAQTEKNLGRYTLLDYEPFFDQVRRVRTGTVEQDGKFHETLSTEVLFDYQECDLARANDFAEETGEFTETCLRPLLLDAAVWGYRYPVDKARFDLAWLQQHLPVSFGHGDINGDGEVGTTNRALPVMVIHKVPTGENEFEVYRWAPSGHPYYVQRADGSAVGFQYYPMGSLAGASASGAYPGFLASVVQLARRDWPADKGPARLPCPALKGPYQWLLPSSCAAGTISQQLQAQLHLPAAVADAVANAQRDFEGATRFEYSLIGAVEKVTRPDGSFTTMRRDVDGRLLEERLTDVTGNPNSFYRLHSSTSLVYDQLMRVKEVRRFDAGGNTLGKTLREWDEEGNLLYECAESAPGDCARSSHGALPSGGTSVTRWYSPEGYVRQELDAEGALTSFQRDARKWVTRVSVSAPGEIPRATRTLWDDDGNRTRVEYLNSIGSVLLFETATYDGFSRTTSFTDTQGRRMTFKPSRRDVVARAQVESPVSGQAPLWRTDYQFDVFARLARRVDNGFTTLEVQRAEGGLVWASRADGEAWHYMTVDASGAPVFEESQGGDAMVVRTLPPDSRTSTSAVVRTQAGAAALTTASVSTVDVLGGVVKAVEHGTSPTEALSRTTNVLRNASGFVTQAVDPEGASTEYVPDFLGRVTYQKQLRLIRPTDPGTPGFDEAYFAFNRRGQVTRVEDPGTQVTTQTYTGFGELKTRTVAGTPQVQRAWAYDELGRVASETTGATRLVYQYDFRTGRLEEVQAGASRQLARDYLYDDLGRLSRARHFNLGLDFTGSPVSSTERLATTSLTYDTLGRVATETTQVGTRPARTTASAWSLQASNARWRRTVTRPGGGTSVEDFDAFGRLTSLSRPGTSRSTAWAWLGELPTAQDSAKPGSPLRRTWTHDAFGQAREWAYSAVDVDTAGNPVSPSEGAAVCPGGWNASCARPVLAASVLRDKAGRILSHSRTVSRPDETPWRAWKGYTFDGLGRLTRTFEDGTLPDTAGIPKSEATGDDVAALAGQVSAQRWSYVREAAVGSVLRIEAPAFGTNAPPPPRFAAPSRGPGHQLTQYTLDGTVTRAVTHDAAGRLVANGPTTYRWDDFDALVAVEADSGVQEALQYDGLGRLVARHNRNRLEEELAWDGAQLVAAYDSSGAATWTATWGPGVDNLVSVAQGGAEYLALSDGKGSVAGYYRAEDNRLVAAADYTPEGRAAVVDYEAGTACVESGATRCGRLGGLPFGFHSAYQSPATGLLYFRNRWYSPEAAQWLSQDALGFVDSFSLYAFNGFDAVNFRDPWGLSKKPSGPATKKTEVDFGPKLIVAQRPKKAKEESTAEPKLMKATLPGNPIASAANTKPPDPGPETPEAKCYGPTCWGWEPRAAGGTGFSGGGGGPATAVLAAMMGGTPTKPNASPAKLGTREQLKRLVEEYGELADDIKHSKVSPIDPKSELGRLLGPAAALAQKMLNERLSKLNQLVRADNEEESRRRDASPSYNPLDYAPDEETYRPIPKSAAENALKTTTFWQIDDPKAKGAALFGVGSMHVGIDANSLREVPANTRVDPSTRRNILPSNIEDWKVWNLASTIVHEWMHHLFKVAPAGHGPGDPIYKYSDVVTKPYEPKLEWGKKP